MAKQPRDSGTGPPGPCPSLDQLLGLLQGGVPDASSTLNQHVDRCPQCSAARAWLMKVLDATAGGPLAEPPTPVIERAIAIFPRKPARERARPSIARLVLDSLASPLPAGVRGMSAGRRLFYEAGWADLDIEIREAPLNSEAFRVTGQLLVSGTSTPTDLIAALWSAESVAVQAMGDATGMFVFPEVQPGAYHMEIWMPERAGRITIESFEL